MPTYILKSSIFLSLFILLSSCSSSSDEFDTYFNDTYRDIQDDGLQAEKSTQEYMNLLLGSKPVKAIELLNSKVIPEHKALLEKIEDVTLTEADLIKFNNLLQEIAKINLEKRLYSKSLFEEIITAHEDDTLNEFEVEKAVEDRYKLNEKYLKKIDEQVEFSEKLVDEHDTLELDEINPLTIDNNVLNEAYDELVVSFTNNVDEFSKKPSENDAAKIDEKLLADQGNPEVVFKGDVTVKNGRVVLSGNSNLLGGSILNVKSYQYGSENPFLKGDFQVDKDGSFELEMDIDKKALDNEPFIVQLGYLPETSDDIEAHNIYGKKGEKLAGPFKHKYTDIKRTRFGVFAYAYLELTPDTKTPLIHKSIDIPDDYGNLKVWIKKEKIETKDSYYDITMKSNLNELTGIKATAKVTDYDVAGYKSSAVVGPDGSFRFRIPRPDPKEIDNKDVMIKIEATSDRAIETEELYGEHGKKFKGELVKDTKRGKKIEYKLHLGKDS